MGVRYCCSINCSNNNKVNPELHFFKVPANDGRARTWDQNSWHQDFLSKPKTHLHQNILFCEKHFEEELYLQEQYIAS